ncbi:MAG TPA: polyphenol oxidase family protein [Acidimicrobiia bacterium]|nr:polyphenol oxidase family protein [Acidimicrobiia bacterium]
MTSIPAAPLLEAHLGAVHVWCSGRDAGNVGDHVGDDRATVERNRRGVARAAGLPDPAAWMWLRQVHGARVHVAAGPAPPGNPPEADAAVTAVRGLPLAVVTADCAPLVLASDDAVAVVHAGHRGLAAGVVEAAVAHVRATGRSEVRAFLGPCIRAARYEFAPGDLEPFVARFGPSVASRTDSGRPALDIPAAIGIVLERLDVTALDDCRVCTASSPAYFSYRRDGRTGRQATVAMLA